MTGYGSVERADGGVTYSLEIRSLNNRYFKASIKLPDGFWHLESEVDKLLRAQLRRGSVSYSLRIRNQNATAGYDINTAALERYLRGICAAQPPEGVTATVDLAVVASLPGVCQPPEPDDATREERQRTVRDITAEAVKKLVAMREAEGRALRDDLLAHCSEIEHNIAAIQERAPAVVEEYHERLTTRVQELVAKAKLELEKDSLAREVAIYADRCDISEEVVRLRCHLEQFGLLCDSDEHAGRRLDFMAQEMLREVNTIGSKSNDAEIASRVIAVKTFIDRLKEQVQNVE